VRRESATGDGAFGGGELLSDVTDGLAAFGEAAYDFVLLGDGEVFEAHAVAGNGAFDRDFVQFVGEVGWVGTGAGVRVDAVPGHRWWPAVAGGRAKAASAGVEDDLTTHDLRHFFASALIAGGASVKQVQVVLGHANAMITLRTYAHLWPGDDDRTRAVMDATLDALRTGCGLDQSSDSIAAGQGANDTI
jgi:hypothetical protein